MYFYSKYLNLKHANKYLYVHLFAIGLLLAMPTQAFAGVSCLQFVQSELQTRVVGASQKVKDFFNPQVLNRMNFKDRKFLRDIILSPDRITDSQKTQLEAVGEKLNMPAFLEQVKKIKSRSRVTRWIFALQSLSNMGTHVPGKSHRRNGFWQHAIGTLSDTISITAEVIVWLLNPIPIENYIYNRDVRSIYKKVADNPRYELSAIEISRIEEAQLDGDIELYRQVQSSFSKMRRGYKKAKSVLFVKGPQLASFLTVLLLLDAGEAVPVEQYVNKVELERESRVEIILDTLGFPHTALRIDDLVYSPGKAIVTVRPLTDYLGETGDAPVLRSVVTMDLNLSAAEAQRVKAEFEKIVWKNYYNITGLHDCTTVVSDVLKKTLGLGVPSHLSSSPSAAMSWWRSEGLLGDSRIGRMETISLASDNRGLRRMGSQFMSIFSQSIEGKLFYFLAPQVKVIQGQLRTERELYWQSETYQDKINSMDREYYEEIAASPQVTSFERLIRIQRLKFNDMTKRERDQKIAQLTQEIESFYEDRVTLLEAAIENEQSTTLITAYESRRRALTRVKIDLLRELDHLKNLSSEN